MIHDYYLMRKDEIVTVVRIDDLGNMLDYSISKMEKEIAPVCGDLESGGLKKWWQRRSVPLKRDRLRSLLDRNQMEIPEEFLIKNLGLSLNDYYWIKPVDTPLNWKDINFYDNLFSADSILPEQYTELQEAAVSYTPNSSLNGNLEKTWCIINGERCLVKGNTLAYSYQSINEVLASNIHAAQGYDNYTSYRLVPVKKKKYKYGCISVNFCDQTQEFVSAWDIAHSEPMPDGMALFEHFINVCAHHGIDADQLRKDLDYQILTDFLITNEDRHLANMGILRDAKTLRFQRMAPIFDSGNSMFFDSSPYSSREALLNIEINSFCASELEMLSLVQNKDQIHLGQLPAPEDVTDAYDQIHPEQGSRNKALGEAFQMKVRLLEEFLQGSLIGKDGKLLHHYSWMTTDNPFLIHF